METEQSFTRARRAAPSASQDVVDRGVALEVCVTSNFQTKAAERPEAHPVRRLFDRGVRVALCTDNPTVSNTTLTREYVEAQRLFGFGRREILRLIDKESTPPSSPTHASSSCADPHWTAPQRYSASRCSPNTGTSQLTCRNVT
jgi:hypothetical protein